jgi:hypothetical protein
MTSREFLRRELGDDLPDSLGSKICVLMDKYLEEMSKERFVKVTYGASGHWYEKKVGQTFKVIEYSESHEAYLVEVPKYAGRFIYERDCELVCEQPTVIELEKEGYDFVNPSHYKKFEKETYEMMIDIWGVEAYIKHCEMCAFKYKLRAGEKPDQPVERDLEKAEWYLNMANSLR